MWSNPQVTADLVTFTEKILTGKRHLLCCVMYESCVVKCLFFSDIICLAYQSFDNDTFDNANITFIVVCSH